jgi:hypothetical protein
MNEQEVEATNFVLSRKHEDDHHRPRELPRKARHRRRRHAARQGHNALSKMRLLPNSIIRQFFEVWSPAAFQTFLIA